MGLLHSEESLPKFISSKTIENLVIGYKTLSNPSFHFSNFVSLIPDKTPVRTLMTLHLTRHGPLTELALSGSVAAVGVTETGDAATLSQH